MVRPAPRHIIPGAAVLKPRFQGELDSLCGLYSIINAIRLAAYPKRLNSEIQADLFTAGVEYLGRHGLLVEVLTGGMSYSVLRRVARRLVKIARKNHEIELSINEQPRGLSADDQAQWLIEQLWVGAPIVCQYPRDVHISVCVGWSPRRWRIFDTDGRQYSGTRPDERAFAFMRLASASADPL